MLKVKAQRVVNARIDKVFSYLSDFARHPEWICQWTVLTVDKVTEGPTGAGSVFRMCLRGGLDGYRPVTCPVQVKEFVPNERLVFDVSRTSVTEVRYSISLESLVSRTRITARRQYLLHPLLVPVMVPLMPILWPLSFWNLTREIRRIKSRVEAEESSRSPTPSSRSQ
jgi:uncharacterized protein YndB with AHSA1/START domain